MMMPAEFAMKYMKHRELRGSQIILLYRWRLAYLIRDNVAAARLSGLFPIIYILSG